MPESVLQTGYSEVRRSVAAEPGVWLRAAVLLIPIGIMYFDTLSRLVGEWWKDPNNSHGILIPPLALYFAWIKRKRLMALAIDPLRAWGLAVVLGALAVYFVGRLGAEFFLTRVSGVLLIAGLILYFLGRKHLRVLAFPILFLCLAIPIPALIFNTVSLPLQALASEWSANFLTFCNVPVLREGNVINLASASLGVAEACSGLRSLVSLIALAVILAYLRWKGFWQRALLVSLSIPLAVLLNIFRIAITGLIADYWDVKYAMGFFHTFSGWLVFVLAFTILFGISAVIQKFFPSPPPDEEAI